MRIQRHAGPESFLARAEAWLLKAEAENSLALAVARQWHPSPGCFEPAYWATIEHRGDIVGCSFRAPPHQIALGQLPLAAVPMLVDDVGEIYQHLPGVRGPAEEAEHFASIWGRRFGIDWRVHTHQRLHVLNEVRMALTPAAGRLRPAARADVAVGVAWLDAFIREAGARTLGEGLIERLVGTRRLFLWDDGGPRSMLATTRDTPNGSCISAVYTPPEYRGRGYATSAVAQLSSELLAAGRRFCFLYTDIGNATSNAIYRRIGYIPLDERLEIEFMARELHEFG